MAVATLRAILVADGSVTALCAADNINPVIRPQSYAAPAIVMERLSLTPLNGLRGSEGLDESRVLLDCLTTSYTTARALAAAVRTALQAGGALLENESDDYDPQTLTYRVSQQWFIWTTS
jgi:hypothetical protein